MEKQYEQTMGADALLNRRLNILLVDDDDICLFINRRVLELSGYCSSTNAASNGKKALEILNSTTTGAIPVPDIIFLDLDMPLMNGIAFLEAYQDLDYPYKDRIAIVLLTSSLLDTDRIYAMSLGVSHYLQKPFTLAAFHSTIQVLFKPIQPFPVLDTNIRREDARTFGTRI